MIICSPHHRRSTQGWPGAPWKSKEKVYKGGRWVGSWRINSSLRRQVLGRAFPLDHLFSFSLQAITMAYAGGEAAHLCPLSTVFSSQWKISSMKGRQGLSGSGVCLSQMQILSIFPSLFVLHHCFHGFLITSCIAGIRIRLDKKTQKLKYGQFDPEKEKDKGQKESF